MACDYEGFSTLARNHASKPGSFGMLEEFNGHARITGPCGDTMAFWVFVQNGTMQKVSFTTDGCGPSLACGSMATVLAQGKSIEKMDTLQQKDILEALGDFPCDHEHCALLAANTLKAACADYLKCSCEGTSPETRGENVTASATSGEPDGEVVTRKKDESDADYDDRKKLQSRLGRIRHKIVVLSGKGGVGKSTVAVNFATALMMSGKRVGLLDVDIHGPSIPTMLGLEEEVINDCEDGLLPIKWNNMKVMSLGFLLRNQDDAVIWRGPMKIGVIKQFLKDVFWGDLDYLIIDSPPGTGDEPLSVCQLIGDLDGAIIVTTPQKIAAVDVRKSITFCRQVHVPVLGVVENMSGFICPKCGEVTQILPSGGGWHIAADMDVPFLGAIPMDPKVAEAADSGRAFIDHYSRTPTAEIMRSIIDPISKLNDN